MISTGTHRALFAGGSRTYFTSSLFFPAEVRRDVFLLYGFVRTADNFVDSTPQQPERFRDFADRYRETIAGTPSGDVIVDGFVDLARRKEFDPDWCDAFLHSMELDLTKRTYHTVRESLDYAYGSAEVIGLFMSRIMGLPARADHAARMLGRAMQYINFIRDIDEDNRLGRTYLPLEESGLPDLGRETATKHPALFGDFVHRQLDRYREWQTAAEQGYHCIPARYRVPVETAADMYGWTAACIRRDPMVVFRRKVKPSRLRIVATVAANAVAAMRAPR